MKGYTIQEAKICGNCAHFRLHYVRCQEDFYLPLRCGHCVHPRRKRRRSEETCPLWEPKKPP